MELIVELGKIASIEVDLAVVFKHPTIRKMASWLDERRAMANVRADRLGV